MLVWTKAWKDFVWYLKRISLLALIGINAEQLQESEKISRTITIHSPINGYVSKVNVNISKYVNPADVMFEIVNTEHLHVELTVFEKDINKIKEGQRIRFTLPNEDDKERLAFVYLIGRSIGGDRTVKVHGHLDKEDEQFLPGMFVNALPEQAIVRSGGKHYIYILKEKRIENNQEMTGFEMIEIQKGVTEGLYTEVTLPDTFDIKFKPSRPEWRLFITIKDESFRGRSWARTLISFMETV